MIKCFKNSPAASFPEISNFQIIQKEIPKPNKKNALRNFGWEAISSTCLSFSAVDSQPNNPIGRIKNKGENVGKADLPRLLSPVEEKPKSSDKARKSPQSARRSSCLHFDLPWPKEYKSLKLPRALAKKSRILPSRSRSPDFVLPNKAED